MVRRKTSYIVEFRPKPKSARGYLAYHLKPYLNRVKWSKKRAAAEAKFEGKKTITKTGEKIKERYHYKLKKVKY